MAVYTQSRLRMNGLLLHYSLEQTKALDQQRAKPVMCGLYGQTKNISIKLQNSPINTLNQWVQPIGLCFHHHFISSMKLLTFPTCLHFHAMWKGLITSVETAPGQWPGSTLATFKTKFLAHDLTLSESPTRTLLKPHTSGLFSSPFLKVQQFILHGKKTISCVFPALGSNTHMNETAATKQKMLVHECYEQVVVDGGDAGFFLRKRKLAMPTRGSIFLSCTASKGKPWNPTILWTS